jgi:GxxExxY protein
MSDYSREEHQRGARGPRSTGRHERRGVPLSALDPTTTEASRKVIGAAIEVHRALGPGFPREVYAAALRQELDAVGVKYEVGRKLPVRYKDRTIGEVSADLYVEGRFIVTVQATTGPVGTPERLALRAQLKAADFELGLIVNFGERRLKDGLVRVVNIDKLRTEKGIGANEEEAEEEGGAMHDFD